MRRVRPVSWLWRVVRRRWRRLLLAAGAAMATAAAAVLVLDRLFPFPQAGLERLRAERQGTFVRARDGAPLRGFLGADDSLMFWIDHDDISPWLIQATMAVEDARFYDHRGVDVRACP